MARASERRVEWRNLAADAKYTDIKRSRDQETAYRLKLATLAPLVVASDVRPTHSSAPK